VLGFSVSLENYCEYMCRNITVLRGLEPAATEEEIRASALQFVRKVGGLSSVSGVNESIVEKAVESIARATTELLGELPARRQPPKSEPPLRRISKKS